MGKNITTKTTIERLAAELKKKFTGYDTSIASALKGAKLEGNAIKLYTDKEMSTAAAFTLDLPADMVLDQTNTQMVDSFTWSNSTYPGSSDPDLDGKPVLVLAVKGEGGTINYSFLNMEKLMNVYTVKASDKDETTTITIDGYEIDVKVNISTDPGNALTTGSDGGLFVAEPEEVDVDDKADKVTSATNGHLAGLDSSGNLTDSGIDGAKVLTDEDISDYTEAEIKQLLGIQ